MLASGSYDDTVRLWDSDTGEHLQTLEGHTDNIWCVAFSPDALTLASGSVDRTIRLWNASTREHLRTLEGHTDSVLSVAFSLDSGTLASASTDGTILLWELTPSRSANAVVSITPSPLLAPAIGQQLTLNIDIADGESVGGYQLTIQFDETALRYVDSTNGNYLLGNSFVTPSVVEGNRVTLAASSLEGESNGDGTLATLTFEVLLNKTSTLTVSNVLLSDSTGRGSRPRVEDVEVMKRPQITGDVNQDGVVNIQDLVLVAGRFGQSGKNKADVNGDNVVNIQDLVLVADAFGNAAAAPSAWHGASGIAPARAEVQAWLTQARQLELTDAISHRGVHILEELLAALTPKETALLPNYPNPFNPETWIPYHLVNAADVQIRIYDTKGVMVRELEIGHQPAGFYTDRGRAAYWNGRNQRGELVASGVYFYMLATGDFTTTRKMLVGK